MDPFWIPMDPTCDMRTEQETGRRALARFRLPYLLIIPDAQKNVREIKGRQNFEKTASKIALGISEKISFFAIYIFH